MIAAMAISLRQEDIRSYRSLRLQINKRNLRRFKSLTEGCVPLHIENLGTEVAISIHPAYARTKDPPPYLQLPGDIYDKADSIRAEGEMNGECEHMDAEKLAVRSMSAIGNHISILVSRIRMSQILAMKDMQFEDIAWMEAFRLDTNAHIIANDGRRKVLLVGRNGLEPEAGNDALISPSSSGAMWTLAVNGPVDYDLMRTSSPGLIWKDNMLKEFDEGLGVIGESRIRYLGIVVNTKMPVGAVGIVGSLETSLSPKQVDEARSRVMRGAEVPSLDAIGLDKVSIAAFLREHQGRMAPQLATGLVILGFCRWGIEFLKLADL